MMKRDWLIVGMKLLGVYFAVQGVVSIGTIVSMFFQTYGNSPNSFTFPGGGTSLGIPFQYLVGSLTTVLLYLIAAFFLIRQTRFCMLFVYPWSERDEVETTAP